jgi:plastocyanin
MNRRATTAFLVLALSPLMAATATANPAAAATAPKVSIVSQSSTCSSFYCFKPATLHAARGATVTWTNRSPALHTVARCTKAACGVSGGTGKDPWSPSGTIGTNKTYKHTFHKVGSYVYYCTIHGYAIMHGKVIVP